jgi:DNA-binding NarL/FixJ family response regulator
VEIFFAVRSGEKRTVVAERLKQRITLRTVEEHLRRIYARVGVHDWCELEAKLRSALARPT